MRVEWRRDETSPPAGASDAGSVPLALSIREEIAANGPITFARFMERALYDPAYGYYATSGDRPTRSGDFLTAPELHPIFGATLARQVDEMWQRLGRPDEFVMREFGAGTGALFLGIADGLASIGSPTGEHDPIRTGRFCAPTSADWGAACGCRPGEPAGRSCATRRVDDRRRHRQ